MTDSERGAGDVEEAVDALYGAEPDGFVAARQRLAGELRSAGRKDEAKQVAALRRPTMAAWALNQVVHRAPGQVDTVVESGARLRRAHEELVSGGDPRAVHRAVEERRAVIAAVAEEALDLLREQGGGTSDARREEVEATLEAASSDPEVAALLRRGRLVTAVPRPAGFGGLLDLPLSPPAGRPAPSTPPPGPGPATDERDERQEAEERERRRQEAERLARLAATAAAAAADAHEALDHAVADVGRLEAELAAARTRAVEAKATAKKAREEEQAARRAAARAEDDG